VLSTSRITHKNGRVAQTGRASALQAELKALQKSGGPRVQIPTRPVQRLRKAPKVLCAVGNLKSSKNREIFWEPSYNSGNPDASSSHSSTNHSMKSIVIARSRWKGLDINQIRSFMLMRPFIVKLWSYGEEQNLSRWRSSPDGKEAIASLPLTL
jgi:hypothetical protein